MSDEGLNVDRLREALVEADIRAPDGRYPHQLTDREVVDFARAMVAGAQQLAVVFRTLAKPLIEGLAALTATLEANVALRSAVLGEQEEGSTNA
jgi:phage I-like protein